MTTKPPEPVGLLLVFTVWATFFPMNYDVAMMVAAFGGLLSIAWYILLSRRLFQPAK